MRSGRTELGYVDSQQRNWSLYHYRPAEDHLLLRQKLSIAPFTMQGCPSFTRRIKAGSVYPSFTEERYMIETGRLWAQKSE